MSLRGNHMQIFNLQAAVLHLQIRVSKGKDLKYREYVLRIAINQNVSEHRTMENHS